MYFFIKTYMRKYKLKQILLTFKYQGISWGNSLAIEEKVKYKKAFESYRNTEEASKFPNMYDLRHIRISKLAKNI